ncbi:MAG: chromate transporter [Chloroflexi bacterium]|nr:chromate transporter [Chloroflexota bacterium]
MSANVVIDEELARDEVRPSLVQLFTAFLEMALSGFGGVLAWAHRSLVERRGWLSEREFAAVLGLCQVLPGGNIINVAVFVGARFQGLRGVAATLTGLLLAPFVLVLVLNAWVANPAVGDVTRPALHGAAPVVAGLVLATAIKMARPYRGIPRAWGVAGLTLLAVGLLQLPLIPSLAVLGPISIALAWRRQG